MVSMIGESNLDFTCIVTNGVANGTRAHMSLQKNNTKVNYIEVYVDGKESDPHYHDDGTSSFYYQVDLGKNGAKTIILRCETMPINAGVVVQRPLHSRMRAARIVSLGPK